jgi:hypothetical protein
MFYESFAKARYQAFKEISATATKIAEYVKDCLAPKVYGLKECINRIKIEQAKLGKSTSQTDASQSVAPMR